MKRIEDIEKILREEKLPDQDTSAFKPKIWQRILKERREREHASTPLIFKIKPWMWAAASMLLLILSIILMWMINSKTPLP